MKVYLAGPLFNDGERGTLTQGGASEAPAQGASGGPADAPL